MDSKNPTTELLNMLSKAIDSKTYGSIEVYLEEGQITQITQRIIKKMKKAKSSTKILKTHTSNKPKKNEEITLNF